MTPLVDLGAEARQATGTRLFDRLAGNTVARGRDDQALRRRASTSLLGLVDSYMLPPGQPYPTPPEDGS